MRPLCPSCEPGEPREFLDGFLKLTHDGEVGNAAQSAHLARLESLANFLPHRSPQSDRAHVAAVCYRLIPRRNAEFLLVRTRAGRWTFPKGGVDGDLSFAAAAAREAFEEAGVRGIVESSPFMLYRHVKSSALGREILVSAFLCQVLRLHAAPETFRDPTWFDPREARQRLAENRDREFALELDLVIERALRRIFAVRSR